MKFVVLAVLAIFVILFILRANNSAKATKQNRQLGQDFLSKNGQEDGIITTDSGLQYKVLEDVVNSDEKPSANSTVTVHYHGTLLSGLVFDSSVDRGRPTQFPLGQVIAGWTEGLQYMSAGEKFRFFIPSQLAYGDRSVASIPPGSTLVFDVELISIDTK
ncbi:FKBP-type peptidyl-prolyl cis-trans isomerase [Agarivorans sp. 1_MG-2023]|uniref:FKBP-type peptidyl-prolyl cis-trans isomerase n=1 Tax=Agarivorans sp. 1_MG-2023 TaxID=3062634 RepID=UPI0026E34DC8|nr:FKBP-type peptidyl-prolyl cis-trans isomerase [Agarivorans sp. 1_MG-2023]MDO6765604.1 FKBP-type peptidyl-prolyl cis-trans isomerase [Agarivorans sp. 1_MG-2023]